MIVFKHNIDYIKNYKSKESNVMYILFQSENYQKTKNYIYLSSNIGISYFMIT